MNGLAIIRVYLLPKGYTDFICNGVEVYPIEGRHDAKVIGGEQDGTILVNVRGAKVIKDL